MPHSPQPSRPPSDEWQLPIDRQQEESWDVIVVGAGPAGSIAAKQLAERGHRVLLLERHRFPRDKVCGDALIPDAINVLRRVGLYTAVRSAGHPLSQAAVYSPSQIEVPVPGEYLTLKREILDAMLARAAVAAGASLCEGTVTGVEPNADGAVIVRIKGAARAYRARVVVLATGASVDLPKQLGMLARPEPSALAVRGYLTSRFCVDRLVISYDRSIIPGYAWIFPLGNGEYNVGCGVFHQARNHQPVNLRTMLSRFLAEFPLAKELTRQQLGMPPLRGAALRCSLSGTELLRDGDVVAIGETIGATFPFTGEGIGKAMETAELAAEAIDESLTSGSRRPLELLPERVKTELLPRYRGYEVAQRWLSQSWLSDLVAWRATRSPYLRDLMEGIVSESVNPQRVFSVRGVLKSLWS